MQNKDLIKLIHITAQLSKIAARPAGQRTKDQSIEEDTGDEPIVPEKSTIRPTSIKNKPSIETRPQNRIIIGPQNNVVSAAIKEMQTAMQTLAEAVIVDAESGTMSFKPRDTVQSSATANVKSSKKSFNDFIAEQYLGALNEDKKGVEWTKDPKITTLPEKNRSQTDIYELDVVMDTLRRIGTSSKEFKIDGNWDFRTNNALKNIMGFAYGLLQLEGDFGLENNLYTYEDWQNFSDLMSGYTVQGNTVMLSPKDKMTRAQNITKHLKGINSLYNHFRQQVLARPEFRPTIEGKRPFEKYDIQGTNKDVLSPQENQMTKSDAAKISITYIAPGLPDKKLDYIPLKALTSKEEYLKWMRDYAGNSEASSINIFNRVIKPKIESM